MQWSVWRSNRLTLYSSFKLPWNLQWCSNKVIFYLTHLGLAFIHFITLPVVKKSITEAKSKVKKWGIFTSLERMNMTKICERDRKLTMTNVHFVNLTKSFNKICQKDKHCLLNMTENQKIYKNHHNYEHELMNMTEKYL